MTKGVPRQGYRSEDYGKPLTPQEIVVLQHICSGLSNQQIATLLGVKLGTVKMHVFNAMCRTGTANRTQLALEFALTRARRCTCSRATLIGEQAITGPA